MPRVPDLTPSSSSFSGRYAPGDVLAGRFRVVGLIGEGGMGEVYLVDDLQLGHPVALKLLPADVAASPVLFRIAMVVLAGHVLVSLSHAGGHFDLLKQPDLLGFSVRWSLYQAALIWISYVALEPTIRRYWPHAMISWTRALGGRLRDALVGRDVLIGLVVGLGAGVLTVLAPRVIPRLATASFWGAEATLNGPLSYVCEVLHVATDGLMYALLFVSVLALLQIVVRRRRVALVAWVLIGGALALIGTPDEGGRWLPLVFSLLAFVIVVVVMTRVGMVALVLTTILMSQAGMLVLAPDHSAWRNGAIAAAGGRAARVGVPHVPRRARGAADGLVSASSGPPRSPAQRGIEAGRIDPGVSSVHSSSRPWALAQAEGRRRTNGDALRPSSATSVGRSDERSDE